MKNLTPAKLSVIMFVAVGLLVLLYIGKRMFAKEEVVEAPLTRNVPMALTDLEPGQVIGEGDIGMGPTSVSDLQPSTFLTSSPIVGRVVKEPIPAARPITTSQVYKRGETPPLKVAAGMSAVTISLADNTAMVNGLIKAGDYVDVLLTPDVLSGDDRLEHGMTMTLLEGVKLLTINRSFVGAGVSSDGNAVTIELTPKQARVVTLGQSAGELRLVYNPNGAGDLGDFNSKYSDRVTIEEILGLKPIVPPEPIEPPFMTEQFSRGRRAVYKFRDGVRIGEGYSDPLTDDVMSGAPRTNGQPNSGPQMTPRTAPAPDDSVSTGPSV